MSSRPSLVLVVTLLTSASLITGCSGGSNPSPQLQATTVNVTVSDPATCSGTNGVFSNVWVTVTDVQAHTSANAGPSDSGWVDLTPNLKQNGPMQIDLLSKADTTCVLAHLGSVSQLQPGTYQQIRLFLLDNSQASTLPQGQNHCGNAANCVMLNADGSTHTLQLSSQAQTGLKIPSGQIAGGQFTVAQGQTVDINIDFQACSSIVVQGNGVYRLEPVLHAGELSTAASSIKGKVVDKNTAQAISGGKVIVALERSEGSCSGAGCVSSNPIDRIFMELVPDADGNFTFCPVPDGTYDVVAVATGVSGNNPVAYAATITTGVQPGTNIGTVPLIPQPTTQQNPSTAPATIKGTITSAPSSTAEIVTVSALQAFNGGTALFVVPLTQGFSTTLNVTTAAGTVDYPLTVPAQNPNIGAFNSGGTTYTQDTSSAVAYVVDGIATGCSPSEAQSNTLKTSGNLTVTAGTESDAATIAFSNCQ